MLLIRVDREWGLISVLCLLLAVLGLSCSDGGKPTEPPPPEAACCLPNGSCVITTKTRCEAQDGFWGGAGSVCLPNPCPPLGACCLPDGTCRVATEAACVIWDGVWHGTEASCDLVQCPQPLGACCFETGNCQYVFEADCPTDDWRIFEVCDPNPCPRVWEPRHPIGQMLLIPAGSVRLGQERVWGAEPVHDVWVDAFRIGRYPVTNSEYKAFIDSGGYSTEAYWNPVGWAWRVSNNITLPNNWNSNMYHGGGIRGNEPFPVNGISWWEADAYCRWAGRRLPTEAEWERAAKGGCEVRGNPYQCDDSDTPSYPWGESVTGQRANYYQSGDPYEDNGWTTPVGYYDGGNHGGFQTIDSPSPYGLYDAAGNVWEWTSTKQDSYPYSLGDGRENPPATRDECCRVLRGGSWNIDVYSLRCAVRSYIYPNTRHNYYGFRCASD